MDASQFVPKFVLERRFAEFQQEIVSIEAIHKFYSTDAITTYPTDRPYSWSMTVSSMGTKLCSIKLNSNEIWYIRENTTDNKLDGIISWKEPNAEGPVEIAMKHIKNSGGGSDWRMLNAGWAVRHLKYTLRIDITLKVCWCYIVYWIYITFRARVQKYYAFPWSCRFQSKCFEKAHKVRTFYQYY
jgi:hypothetical protein